MLKLTKLLYPKGRAFRLSESSLPYRLHKALAVSEQKAYDDALSILDAVLPDNDNFTADDATQWERRLGLTIDESVPLADRKLAIQRKMQHPGDIPARQSAAYIQGQLQAAGFYVYVHENPNQNSPADEGLFLHVIDCGGGDCGPYECGQLSDSGNVWQDNVANHIDYTKEESLSITSLYGTFFIAGETLPNEANISSARREEFRTLLLKLKPVNQVAFLLINYT